MSTEGNERPPYITFEMRGVEDRAASLLAGYVVEKDVPYVIITRPGSRDTLEQVAEVWLKNLKQKNAPRNWEPAFRQAYELWLKGETGVTEGTPIKGWTMLGAAAQKTLINAGIMTVEDLAACPDQDLAHVGTGAVSFKQKAKAYLEAASGPGKTAERVSGLETKMNELIELTRKQAEEIQRLRQFEPKKEKV